MPSTPIELANDLCCLLRRKVCCASLAQKRMIRPVACDDGLGVLDVLQAGGRAAMAVNCSLELGPCPTLGSTPAEASLRAASSPGLAGLPTSAMDAGQEANISLRNSTDGGEVVLEGYVVMAAVSIVLALLILVTVVGE